MFKKNEFCICWIPLIFLGAACGQRNDFRGPQTFGAPQVRAFDDYSQSDSPRQPPPAILTHKQAVTNDGVFNYVFAADNGLKQGESISPDGTRTGAYEYIDPNGKTISVKYKAGKDGFMIIEGDHVPRQPKPVKPIPEFQPPEYRKDYRPSHGQYPDDERTADENDERQDDQRYQQKRVNEGREKFEERQRKNQKYTTQEYQKPKLFRPSEQSQERQQGFLEEFRQAGRGAPRRPAAEPNRAMLYNVEQRHSTNYRKYQDNGQPAGSPESPQSESSASHFGGGYNFEFKG